MNKVILLGRLTKQPEVRTGTTGTAIARYTLAVRRAYTQQGDVDYIPCVAFGSAASFAQQYFKKGQMVAVTGHLQITSWTDDSGYKRWRTEVIIEEQHFAEGKRDHENLYAGIQR